MVLEAYDYLFAIAVVFAFLDAWNIGANDVGNAFATSVSSRSLTLLQAMLVASVMEFSGALGVGARVAETIRTKIIDPKLYADDPAVLMLAMLCAVIGSAVWLTVATKCGLPVSTTHSIIGGVIGSGVASVGITKIDWSIKGVSQVFVAWVAAPGIAGVFASIIFLITKYGVMKRKNPVKMAFFSVPIYFALTSALMAMLLIWKGASSRIKLSEGEIAGACIGVGLGVALLVVVFLLPWLHRKVVMDDWQLRWYHIPLGPLLLRRGPPPAKPADWVDDMTDYYAGHATAEELEARRAGTQVPIKSVNEKDPEAMARSDLSDSDAASERHNANHGQPTKPFKSMIGPKPLGKLFSGPLLWWWFKKITLHGVDQDVISDQKKPSKLTGNLESMHANVEHYDNKAEFMYSFLQVMTAAVASFSHGANDVSNAIGPFATIFDIWHSGKINKQTAVPLWILAFGGIAIVIGLWTYGYKIMRNLGNRLTLHSPSRGFSMELGSAITVIMATRLKIPVSTTQCICGATVGVGLCAGTLKSINWRMVAWIYAGWFITVPVAAFISGSLMAFVINAPRYGLST